MLTAIRSIVAKDLKISIRNPVMLVLSIIVPVVFIFLYSLVAQVSFTNPIAIANNSDGQYSDQLVDRMKEMKSVDGPYFEVLTTDPEKAHEKYNGGDVAGVIEIPESFDESLDKGKTPEVNLRVRNMNADTTKNLELRLSHAVYLFQEDLAPDQSIDVVNSYSKFDQDVSFKWYTGVGLLVFAVLYASMVNTGMLLTREWEDRTAKELILTPSNFSSLILGKWTTSFIQTLISTLLVLVVLIFMLDFPLTRINITFVFWLFILFLLGASIGALAASTIKKTLPIITLSALIGISVYLISGNESSIRGFAYGGFVEPLWKVATYIPVTDITNQLRLIIITGGSSFNIISLLLTIGLILAFGIASVFMLRKGLRISGGQ
ncbi:ABC transporter permease [Virgibacillus dokdonensis]|uniref:ABC transporter permease n=1 Tax=Virgibacillus dokdonensis TaxID=302167 RepID=UPI000989F1EB|nr:ABC transporter permease [Virgibacillus dokdonensis]